MIVYGIPTYAPSQALYIRDHVLPALYAGTVVPDRIVIVDNANGQSAALLAGIETIYPNVEIIVRKENILSGAWNDIMRLGAEYTIIANDDVIPDPHSIEALVGAAILEPDVAMWNGSGHSGNSYSFFLLTQWAYAQVGPFDEGFKPAYFEDNDFDYRLIHIHLLTRREVPLATFQHVGSATVKSMTPTQQNEQHLLFRKNRRRYVLKWGGEPAHETYKVEFAGIDFSDL